MLLKAALSLALFIQCIEGFERDIIITESDLDDLLVEGDEDNIAIRAIGSASGVNTNTFSNSCCIYDNCYCSSLYSALANLTSNVFINITTDVELSSIIPIVDLANVAITGHNNPTVYCNNSGGLHFISCYNCTIEGITWKGCGAINISAVDHDAYPVLELTNSSQVMIQNCLFQQSIGQAVVLSGMSGEVNIKYCNFLYNKQYEGHGTAIHYTSKNKSVNSSLQLMITGCNFFYNERAKSIVYFDGQSIRFCKCLKLQNSKFHHNKGVPIYLSNQDLHINGKIEFYKNFAENGGGMFISDYSNVIFHKNASVNFTSNRAADNGGALFLTNHSSIVFTDHSTSSQCCDNDIHSAQCPATVSVKFYYNRARFGQHVYAHNSNVTVGNRAKVTFIGTDEKFTLYSSVIYIEHHSYMTFEGNSETLCNYHWLDRNVNDGTMHVTDSTVTFKGNSTAEFYVNVALNGAMYISNHSTVTFEENSVVTFGNNRALSHGGAMCIDNQTTVIFEGNSAVTFESNYADISGGAMCITGKSTIMFGGNSKVNYDNNEAGYNGGAMFIGYSAKYVAECTITFEGNSTVTFVRNSADSSGGAIQIIQKSTITFQGNSIVKYECNIAGTGGGAIYNTYSTITFKGNSTVTFNYNEVFDGNGGAIVLYGRTFYKSNYITFEGNSIVTFYSNSAPIGGGVYIVLAIITFKGNSVATLQENFATDNNGGAIYIDRSSGTFKDNSVLTFIDNTAESNGAAMSISGSSIGFKGNSSVKFVDNVSHFSNGGAVHISDHTTITFEGSTKAQFNKNVANLYGGAVYIHLKSTITIKDSSSVTFNDNIASSDNRNNNGGALYIDDSSIMLEGKSSMTLYNNIADNGGAVYINDHSTITFGGSSTITFNNNMAGSDGGVMYVNHYSIIAFKENTLVTFNNNMIKNNYIDDHGGALYVDNSSAIMLEGRSTMILYNNIADNGGAMYINDHSNITFGGNSIVTFDSNMAANSGGDMYIGHHSTITFKGNTSVTFSSNINKVNSDNGGVAYSDDHSAITFEGNSTVIFYNSTAYDNGGALYVNHHSDVTFKGKSTVTFHNNKAASNGGAVCMDHNSTARYIENSTVVFNSNKADLGGSIFGRSSSVSIGGNSLVHFNDNMALRDGGAIYCSDRSHLSHFNNSYISFYNNTANDYGGAVYVLLKESSINLNSSGIHFKYNTAGITQNSIYINIPQSCISSCLFRTININNEKHFQLTTSPHKLMLYNPAKCISSNNTDCDTYYMNNIMLGQDITFEACVLDYYDQPAEATQFLITSTRHQYYNITGSKYITISCNLTAQGINIIGNLQSNNSYNYSMTFSLYVARISESKIISVNLIVELSRCHAGFWYSTESQKCECYEIENIVSCSGSNSTIKRGYWFGIVNSISTVTSCPNDYCNFTCCEITNGIYHLSPVRANQCKSHRSGIACGNCEKGYTLSFDSPDCVDVNECTTGQTILVISLSVLYWIAVVIAVFVTMYFKVTIGSLYAIIYYYSIVDILLSQVLFISNELYTTVNIMSSLAKLTP